MNVHPPKPAGQPATYADIEAAPEHLVAEIIDGELVTHPRPSFRHGGAAMALGTALTAPYQFRRDGGPGGWVFIIEPELRFDTQLLVPDLAGWRVERLVDIPEKGPVSILPDWVCEVLSASTERRDRTVKRRIYAEAGVPFFWLVDPRHQSLDAFELVSGQWMLNGSWSSDDLVCAKPFDAIRFSLADLWPLDRPLGFAESPQHLFAGDR